MEDLITDTKTEDLGLEEIAREIEESVQKEQEQYGNANTVIPMTPAMNDTLTALKRMRRVMRGCSLTFSDNGFVSIIAWRSGSSGMAISGKRTLLVMSIQRLIAWWICIPRNMTGNLGKGKKLY